MEQEFFLTPEETATFNNLKAQSQAKQRDVDAIQGAMQGALLLLTNQKGHPNANASLTPDNTKLVVSVPDPPEELTDSESTVK
jgi:hypothetical protein